MGQEKRDLRNDKVEISVVAPIEIKRAFRALAKNKDSYLHKVFSDDEVFDVIQELRGVHNAYFESDESFTK